MAGKFTFSDAAKRELSSVGLKPYAINYLERPVNLALLTKSMLSNTWTGKERPKDTLQNAATALRGALEALNNLGYSAGQHAVMAAESLGKPDFDNEDWKSAEFAYREIWEHLEWGAKVLEAAAENAQNPGRGRPAWNYYDSLLGEIALVARDAGFVDTPEALARAVEVVMREIGEAVADPRKMGQRALKHEPLESGPSDSTLRAMAAAGRN